MQTPHSVADDAPPPPHAPLVVDVLDPTDLDDTKSQTAPSKEIIQTMQTSHSAVDCLSTLKDVDAPPSSDPLAVVVLDRNQDDHLHNLTPSKAKGVLPFLLDGLRWLQRWLSWRIRSWLFRKVANITVNVQEEPKTLENPKQDQFNFQDGIKSSSLKMAYDELHEILSWMPAKAAIRYSSSLCKWLCNIHAEPRFIQKQCIRSCGQDSGFFLQYKERDNDRIPNEFEFHLLPWETGYTFGIPRESLDYLPKSGRILSSSNGLLLLGNRSRNGNYIFRVCNPATREWTRLRTPKGFKVEAYEALSPLIECYPWGHGVLDKFDFPNDYTIALPILSELLWQEVNGFLTKTHKQRLLIYSHGRWDEELCDVIIEGRVVRYEMPVGIFSTAAKGLLVHYLCDSGKPGRDTRTLEPYIAAFNIREKKLSREIKLPEGLGEQSC